MFTFEIQAGCLAAHLGLWLVEDQVLSAGLAAVRGGYWRPPPAAEERTAGLARDGVVVERQGSAARVLYVRQNGVAVVPVVGPMMPLDSKFGGANTARTRRALRAAVADEEVQGILLALDSPGGTVAGTAQLAAEVVAARAAKPVWAHGDNIVASAAYWVGVQAERLHVSPVTEVGSIGVISYLYDTSGQAELEGIKVRVFRTGEYKGIGVPGEPVTDAQAAYLQQRVEDMHGHFLAAVAQGRSMEPGAVKALADGRVWIAAKARKLGLIDGIGSLDETLAALARRLPAPRRDRAGARIRESRLGA